MIRVHVICEGQTEETFVKEILNPHFSPKGIYLFPSLIGKPGHKGGYINFDRLLLDLKHRLLTDITAYCTTFIDFYGLPNDFPGKDMSIQYQSIAEKANCIYRLLCDELNKHLEPNYLLHFIPYVQMHEFEGLLFSDPLTFAKGIWRPDIADDLESICGQFHSPEEINDNQLTAPSKRIKKLYPEYEKPIHGTLAALEIGLPIIRKECRLFDAWINQLEDLV